PGINRLTPAIIGRGGRVRLDGTYAAPAARVTLRRRLPPATDLVPPNDIGEMEPGGPVLVQLPAGLVEDAYDVTLWGSTATPSAPQTLVIVDPARPSLDAPDILRHSRGSDL